MRIKKFNYVIFGILCKGSFIERENENLLIVFYKKIEGVKNFVCYI